MSTHVSIAQAARMSGRSEKTIRRWIASGKLPAQKVAGAFAIDTAALTQLVGDVFSPGVDTGLDTDVHPPTDMRLDILRAEAMAAYTRSLLEPLVATIERQAKQLVTAAETIGELRAQNQQLLASTAAPSPDPTPGPPLPWRRALIIVAMAVLAMVAAVVLVAWPR